MKTKYLSLWTAILFVTAFLLSSCQKDLEETITAPPVAIARPDSGTGGLFEAVASKKGIIKQGTFRGQPITYEEIDGKATWQGDILLTKEDLAPVDTSRSKPGARIKGAGLETNDRRWPNFRIPYEIGPGLNNTRISAAINEWQNKTPIRFVVRTNETDYVRFELSSVNRSPVGRVGGKQIIEIANAEQTTGVILHEIGHAIGLEHEATRPDREDFINYYPKNVEPGKEHNFKVYSTTFGHGPFDFESIMLYASTDFGKLNPDGSKKTVLERKNGSTWGSNTGRSTVSFGDEQAVRVMYSSIYVVQNGILYTVGTNGDYAAIGGGWSGSAPTIAQSKFSEYVYLIHGGSMWVVNRFSGGYGTMAKGRNWTGAVGLTGSDPQGNLYVQQGDYIWKIDQFGNHRQLGGGGWSGTQAMYYHNGSLWAIWKNGYLYKVNTSTGAYQELSGGWGNVKGMAAIQGHKKYMHIMKGEALWRFDTETNQSTFVSSGWKNTVGMTGVSGFLFIVSDGRMYKLGVSGNIISTYGGYNGVTSIGSTRVAGLD